MLKNFFSIALRQMKRNKIFSVINILGLAIGMACCLMILMYVQDELAYDKFHEKGDRIYRMALERIYPGRSTSYALIPHSYAESVEKEFPEIEETTRLFSFGANLRIKHKETIYEERNAIWADSTFFAVFSIPLLQGDPKTALSQPNSVVLTEQTAKKYFPDTNPIGQILDIPQNDNDLQVTGVCQNVPENSHFTFDLLQSSSTLGFLEQTNHLSFFAYTYLLLKENTDPKILESKFPDLVTKYASGQVLEQFGVSYEEYQKAGNGYHYFLQALPNIHLESQLEAELRPPGSQNRIYIFTLIALFILLIACINFMNLATARSAERAQEIGVRKTLGSGRLEIALQFLFEAVVLSITSTLIAWGFLQYLLPLFNNLSGKAFVLSDIVNWYYAPIFLGFAVIIGLLAGSYPAMVLSAYDPMEVLRGRFWSNKKGGFLRNALVVFQFGISATLIICTIVVYSQLSYIESKSLGFNKDYVVSLQGAGFLDQQQTETFKNEIGQLPHVVSVAGCNAMPGGRFFGLSFKPEGDNEMVTGRGLIIDDQYLDCMQMNLIKGRSYAEEFADSLSVIVNETALRDLGIKDPIGKQLTSNDNFLNPVEGVQSRYTIVGVVEDFHYQSLHQKIEPLFFVNHYLNQRKDNLISIRMKANKVQESLVEVEQLWKAFLPDQPFTYTFLDRDLAQLYEAEQTSQIRRRCSRRWLKCLVKATKPTPRVIRSASCSPAAARCGLTRSPPRRARFPTTCSMRCGEWSGPARRPTTRSPR
ncbi:MAG: ABC transporter permease, partial [Bacteroidota bacterium]